MRSNQTELSALNRGAQPCRVADGTVHHRRFIITACNQIAQWDDNSEMGYRCETCMSIVGSIGMPKHCHEEMKTHAALKQLGAET